MKRLRVLHTLYGLLAQLVEHWIPNPKAIGSIPVGFTFSFCFSRMESSFEYSGSIVEIERIEREKAIFYADYCYLMMLSL